MSLIGRLVGALLPHGHAGGAPHSISDALAAARAAHQETAESARSATAAVTRHRRSVEAERERIKARTEAAQEKRKPGQTSHVAHVVEDAIKARSFGGMDEREG